MRPGRARIEAQDVARIRVPEHIGRVAAGALKSKHAGELILAIDRFIEAGLQSVLVHGADGRNLVVVA